MELDSDSSDTDSQEHRLIQETKRLKHVFEPYFKRIFSGTSFVKHMNQRCSAPHDSTSYILLCEAIKRNDNASAQILLRQHCKANLGRPDPGKDIPLQLAVLAGNVEIVEALLARGARASVSFQDQRESLHLVCDRSSSAATSEEARLAIAGLLVRHGADINAVERSRGDTPLILAVRSKLPGLVRFLLEAGAYRHYANKYGETAFHVAYAVNAGVEVAEMIYDDGFDLEWRDENGCTVFSYAVRNLMNFGYSTFCGLSKPVRGVLYLLERGVSINSSLDKRSNRILHMICQNQAARAAKMFLERGAEVNALNDDGKSALHFCAEHQPREIVDLLLEHGADVHALTANGQSVLHFAAANKHPGVLESLLHHGLDVDAKGRDGNFTPLFNAVWSDRYENARLLLDWRAKVNERIINSQIALHVAVDQKHASCVELLLEHGSDVNVLDDYGNTPLTISLYQIAESASADWWDCDGDAGRPTEAVQRALIRHTAKCQLAGRHLSEQSLRIMGNPHFRDYYADCLRELGLMRDNSLIDGISFFDLLIWSQNKLILYERYDVFAHAFQNSRYRERFPIYSDNLYRVIESTLERHELATRSADSLVRIVQNIDQSWAEVHLPTLVVEHILEYFNITDLRSLARVYD